MSILPGGSALGYLFLLAYLVPIVVIGLVAYLVLRFGIRDGLRGHARWLERRDAARGGGADDPRP